MATSIKLARMAACAAGCTGESYLADYVEAIFDDICNRGYHNGFGYNGDDRDLDDAWQEAEILASEIDGSLPYALFDKVADAVEGAYAVAWDGLHRIYVLSQADGDRVLAELRSEGCWRICQGHPATMFTEVVSWWEESDDKRFIQRWSSQNDEYDLVSQYV